MVPEANVYAMKSGLVFGTAFAVSFFVSMSASANPAVSYMNLAIYAGVLVEMFRSAMKCRDEVLEGEMRFGTAWWYIVQLFMFSSMIAGVWKYFYLRVLHQDALEKLSAQVMQTMEEAKMDAAMIEEMSNGMAELMQPANFVLYSVMTDVMIGVAVGFIFAFFLKKNQY